VQPLRLALVQAALAWHDPAANRAQLGSLIGARAGDVDVVVLPTRRHTPRTVEAALQREETDVPRNPELENTGQFNIYGIPAISVPCGFTAAGLPVGLMIAGPRFAEGRVLALARAFEQASEWHTKRPPLTPDTPVPQLARTTGD